MKKRNQAMPDHRGKFSPTYEGLYMVMKAFSEGALILPNMDGHDFNMPINSNAVIQYFAWRSFQVRPLFLYSYVNKQSKKIKNAKKKKKKKKKTKQNKTKKQKSKNYK